MLKLLTGAVPKEAQELEAQGSWPKAWHVWKQQELDALAVALASGRPLLVKGEPGVGKSQIARAAAARLCWRFLYEVVTPRLEPQDLMWRFDAVRRLADAGQGGALKADRDYYEPGALWQALEPSPDTAAAVATGAVLLIDEIDKADSDLPNSLLEVMGNRSFSTPWKQQVPADKGKAPAVLFVVTNNDERELPMAFMRRCVVLEIKAPDETVDAQGFEAWLQQRALAHFRDVDDAVLATAATRVRMDRAEALPGQGARAGLAEYLDLLRALREIAPGNPDKQLGWLAYLGPYVLRKQGQDQTVDARKPRTRDPTRNDLVAARPGPLACSGPG